jgi:hypothetical protein
MRASPCAIALAIAALLGTVAHAETPGERPATRTEKSAAWAKAAQSRTSFTIRGLRLGMTLAELEAKLGAEVVEVRPERLQGWKLPEFTSYEETLRLSDGAKLTVTFSSPVTGAVGGVVLYEQTLRDGPTPEKMLADLNDRYGASRTPSSSEGTS